MKKPTAPNPMPTSGAPYDTYLWPRSQTPEKDALYAFLRALGWRYSVATGTFHTPEAATYQTFGALEYDPEFRWARIQPPSTIDPERGAVRAAPVLELVRDGGGWIVDADEDPEEEPDGAPCCPDPDCGRNPCTFPGYAANH